MSDYKENNGIEPLPPTEYVDGEGTQALDEVAETALPETQLLEDDTAADVPATQALEDAPATETQASDEADEEKEQENEDEDEGELCLMCGEKPADKSFGEDYDLCADCRKSLIKSPLRFGGFFTVVILFCVGLWGFMFSAGQTGTITAVTDGDKYYSENKLNSAIEAYSQANNIGFKGAKKLIRTAYKSGYLSSINSAVETYFYDATALEEGEKLTFAEKAGKANLNAPWNKDVKQIYVEYNNAMNAYETYYAYLAQYDEQLYYGTIEPKEIPYDDIMKQYKQLKGETQKPSDLAFINYCEYYLNLICEKGSQKQYEALTQVAAAAPEYDWLYLTPLAELNVKLGNYDEALENCEALEKKNAEDVYGEYYRSQIYRMKQDYEAALDIALKMVEEYEVTGFYYAYYEAAINCFLLGDYERAKEYSTVCYEGAYQNLQTVNMHGLICKLTDDEAGYEAVVALLTENNLEISPTVEQFLKGEITAVQMFNERERAFE